MNLEVEDYPGELRHLRMLKETATQLHSRVQVLVSQLDPILHEQLELPLEPGDSQEGVAAAAVPGDVQPS